MLRYALSALAALAFLSGAAHAACPGPSLTEFGHNSRPINGVRPLLIILVDFDDAPVNPARSEAYYRRLVFGTSNSVNATYMGASDGRFYWGNAGIVSIAWRGRTDVPLPAEFNQQILRQANAALRARTTPGRRTFESFDTNGDRTISAEELTILRVTNSPVWRLGATGGPHGADLGGGYTYAGAGGFVDEEVDQNGIAHELWHALGFDDHIYGPGAGLNYRASFFAAHFDADDSPGALPLDPYHRMRAGWIRPTLVEMGTSGSRTVRMYGDDPRDNTLLFYSNAKCAQEFFLMEFHNPARSPAGIGRGMFDVGALMWFAKPTADFSPFQFNWPPPFTRPFRAGDTQHAIADYVVSPAGPGAQGVIDATEFSPVWSDGSATNFQVSAVYGPANEAGFVGWRRTGGRFFARIDTINGAATPPPISLAGPYRFILDGMFPVSRAGITAELISLRGRFPVQIVSYSSTRIELRPEATLAPGTYRINLIGAAGREINTGGRSLVTFN